MWVNSVRYNSLSHRTAQRLSYGFIRCVTELQLQGLSRGIIYESYGYVRVDTVWAGLGNRLRAVVTGLWRVYPHDPLHLSPGIRLRISGPT